MPPNITIIIPKVFHDLPQCPAFMSINQGVIRATEQSGTARGVVTKQSGSIYLKIYEAGGKVLRAKSKAT